MKKIIPFISPAIYIIFGITFFLNAISSLNIVALGNFSFWYDPARDLLQALDNLAKITLIGPPSGIPGVFYGPYWIWLLSIGLKISKDPRIVTFLIASIPYVFIFPFILWKFSDIFGRKIALGLVVLFIFSNFYSYSTSLWNPNVSPFLFLLIAYIFSHIAFPTNNLKNFLYYLFAGFFVGLLSNFNLSFGLGVVGGSSLYIILSTLLQTFNTKKYVNLFKGLILLIIVNIGVFISYLPFFLFELRHNFIQSKALIHTITNSMFYNSAVVGQTGIKGLDLVRTFFGVFGGILQIPELLVYPLLIALLIFFIIVWKKRGKSIKISLEDNYTRLFIFLLSVFISIVYLYFTTKNPIWIYHFIGIDILYLLFIGLIAKQLKTLRNIFLAWIFLICLIHFPQEFLSLSQIGKNDNTISSLSTKELVIEKIQKDAGKSEYNVFVYNPAIYVYDYDYLLQWKTGKKALFHPTDLNSLSNTVYIISPKVKPVILEDYLHYVTPTNLYHTDKVFTMGDGIQIVKRLKAVN